MEVWVEFAEVDTRSSARESKGYLGYWFAGVVWCWWFELDGEGGQGAA